MAPTTINIKVVWLIMILFTILMRPISVTGQNHYYDEAYQQYPQAENAGM